MEISDLDRILGDLTDDFWKNRIRNSVFSAMELYDLTAGEIQVFRQAILPEEIYIAAVEECVLENARKQLEDNFGVGTPLTVIRHKGKNVLFMGSSRSLQYMILTKSPDCVVIELPEHIHPKMVSEAAVTLQEVYRVLNSTKT